ncbi:reverse transcriptase domain-containing protein [Tanacetum coccineum]
MAEDSRVRIILGRPFLATARAMIDVFNKKMTLRVGDDEVIFDVDQSIMRPPIKDDECYGVDDLDDTIDAEAQELLANEELDSFLSRGLEKSIDQSDLEGCEPVECKTDNDSDSDEPIRRFFQIPIAPEDQEKETFTCTYGTFAYQRMPFGYCNTPATFQRCMTTIFHDMVEDFMEVFMNEFSVFGNSFDCCLANLDRMLARCEETNLVLNWEKCHFMVKEEIVLGHKISGAGIEVDRAKIDVIAKLPYPTNVKGDAKPRLIRWVLFLQGFDIEIKDKRGAENLAADHLSRLENPDLGTFTETEIANEFPDEHLMTEVTNRAINRMLERSVGYNLKNWSENLDDALWAFKTAYKTPTGCTLFRLVYGKAYHFPVEIEHKAYWATPGSTRKEIRDGMTLGFREIKISKLETWTVEIIDKNKVNFKVNGQRLKKYHERHIDAQDKEMVKFEDDTT